jgi:hypothetical protein
MGMSDRNLFSNKRNAPQSKANTAPAQNPVNSRYSRVFHVELKTIEHASSETPPVAKVAPAKNPLPVVRIVDWSLKTKKSGMASSPQIHITVEKGRTILTKSSAYRPIMRAATIVITKYAKVHANPERKKANAK